MTGSGTSSTTTRFLDDSTSVADASPAYRPCEESVNDVPGQSVNYVPGCSRRPAYCVPESAGGAARRPHRISTATQTRETAAEIRSTRIVVSCNGVPRAAPAAIGTMDAPAPQTAPRRLAVQAARQP
jgi:hypothetical protein